MTISSSLLLRSGEMIVSSAKYIVQEHSKSLYEMKMTVTVKNFENMDVGSYRCIAKNSLGEVDSSIRLYGEESIYSSHVIFFLMLFN